RLARGPDVLPDALERRRENLLRAALDALVERLCVRQTWEAPLFDHEVVLRRAVVGHRAVRVLAFAIVEVEQLAVLTRYLEVLQQEVRRVVRALDGNYRARHEVLGEEVLQPSDEPSAVACREAQLRDDGLH